MKNLEQFGLVALDAAELQQVQGGSLIDIAIDFIKGALGGDKKPIVVECQGPCKVTIPQ
ncbi:hypothetical protein AAE02nite_48020 [Adhaeribacter aerolatus]|uniref:Uncharacterized protein n=1 Tax=Adhaeribacter aerolatus TaxID=670289 RepID=A0A512B587_9BACT|nr:hypothetical protein [Adhaeribacter aerolatus]GEO07138.1 hypothetical protein AAE02nite_48020 [Adhaeribacter aerolatus]